MILAGVRIEACQSKAHNRLFSLSSFSPHCISLLTFLPLPKYLHPRYHAFFFLGTMYMKGEEQFLWK